VPRVDGVRLQVRGVFVGEGELETDVVPVDTGEHGVAVRVLRQVVVTASPVPHLNRRARQGRRHTPPTARTPLRRRQVQRAGAPERGISGPEAAQQYRKVLLFGARAGQLAWPAAAVNTCDRQGKRGYDHRDTNLEDDEYDLVSHCPLPTRQE